VKTLLTLFKATFAFLRALVERRDPVMRLSDTGHSVLRGWEDAPEENLLREFQDEQETPKGTPKGALYCFKGTHAGEVLFLQSGVNMLGASPDNHLVVTPEGGGAQNGLRFFVNGVTQCLANPGTTFKVNGHEEHQASLFDFDEVELMGNQFLVMDLGVQTPSPANSHGELI
jgi:hypothetical protein